MLVLAAVCIIAIFLLSLGLMLWPKTHGGEALCEKGFHGVTVLDKGVWVCSRCGTPEEDQ